jgi:hypothetical protein
LLIGTFAPDFEYFLRLAPDSGFGHTLLGTFTLTLPLALLVLWLFHDFVKLPLARLLPDAIQRRLATHFEEFHFRGVRRFALIVASLLAGIATHLAWDSFTHANTWSYRHWPILSQSFPVPILGLIPLYKVFQHGSTIIGTGVLSTWLVFRYRISKPTLHVLNNAVSPTRKITVGAIIVAVALAGAIIRAVAGMGIPHSDPAEKRFVGLLIVTAIALVWWQLVAYGLFATWKISSTPQSRLPRG